MAAAVIGAYWYGSHSTAVKYKKKIEAFQTELNEKKTIVVHDQSRIVTKVVTQYVDRVKVIHDTVTSNQQQATTILKPQTNLSEGWVYLHDSTVLGLVADPSKTSNQTPSNIPDNQALSTVIDNYGACQANAAQLKALQEWVSETKKSIDAANKGKGK